MLNAQLLPTQRIAHALPASLEMQISNASEVSTYLKEVNGFLIICFNLIVPIGCSRSSECLETHSCVNNMCLPKCSLDQDCALNEKCLDGNCLREYF